MCGVFGVLAPGGEAALAVPSAAVEAALATAAAQGMPGAVVGEVVPVAAAGGRRYVEAG